MPRWPDPYSPGMATGAVQLLLRLVPVAAAGGWAAPVSGDHR
jgi:hypothetical protein